MSGVYTVDSTELHQYDTIKRLVCSGNHRSIVLDVHRRLFPCAQHDQLNIVFTDTIHSTDQLHDGGDYCMNGTIIEAINDTGSEYTIYASFGGLMMMLRSATDPHIRKNFAVCVSRKCASLKK